LSHEEIAKKLNELTNSHQLLDEDKEKSMLKIAKILERKRRKHERLERKAKAQGDLQSIGGEPPMKQQRIAKYLLCEVCKNPRGASCEYSLCKTCCKNKVHTELIECKGHGLRSKKSDQSENVPTDQTQQESILT
jgi:hypothetical protein